jgi:cytochrome c oxidase cbb3-type subunit 4
MKFIDYLTSITGVGIFPMISLLVFFIFFIALGFWTVKADKERIKYLSEIPIESETDQFPKSTNHN